MMFAAHDGDSHLFEVTSSYYKESWVLPATDVVDMDCLAQ